MTITRQQVRDAIARAERHNPTATELSHGRAVISEGDLFVLVEAAKCATFRDAVLGNVILDPSAPERLRDMEAELREAKDTIRRIRDALE